MPEGSHIVIVRTEPKDWMMHSVLLYFDRETPDGEDEAAKRYLADHNLVPKRTFDTEVEDRKLEVYSFGGCYLNNRHLSALADIQWKAVERELLADKIVELLVESPSTEARKLVSAEDQTPLRAVVESLINEYDRDSSYEVNGDGHLQVTLDADAVHESFLNIVASQTR